MNKFKIGEDITINGELHEVIHVSCIAFSDLGCGPVFDIYKLTIKSKETGLIEQLTIEE